MSGSWPGSGVDPVHCPACSFRRSSSAFAATARIWAMRSRRRRSLAIHWLYSRARAGLKRRLTVLPLTLEVRCQ